MSAIFGPRFGKRGGSILHRALFEIPQNIDLTNKTKKGGARDLLPLTQ